MPAKTHPDLPIATALFGDVATAQVRTNKLLEERVLRVLDDLAADPETDKRWLATGRTDIEKGFMSVNRAVFKSARVELAGDE